MTGCFVLWPGHGAYEPHLYKLTAGSWNSLQTHNVQDTNNTLLACCWRRGQINDRDSVTSCGSYSDTSRSHTLFSNRKVQPFLWKRNRISIHCKE